MKGTGVLVGGGDVGVEGCGVWVAVGGRLVGDRVGVGVGVWVAVGGGLVDVAVGGIVGVAVGGTPVAVGVGVSG